MVTNIWDGMKLYCGCHNEPVEMVVMEGTSPFFACPKYMLKDEKHPDGHEDYEPPCSNRISFTDATNIVDRLGEIITESLMSGEIADFTGYSFKYRFFDVRVLYHSDGDIRLSIINRRVIR